MNNKKTKQNQAKEKTRNRQSHVNNELVSLYIIIVSESKPKRIKQLFFILISSRG